MMPAASSATPQHVSLVAFFIAIIILDTEKHPGQSVCLPHR
jgi:hypothetical protein